MTSFLFFLYLTQKKKTQDRSDIGKEQSRKFPISVLYLEKEYYDMTEC